MARKKIEDMKQADGKAHGTQARTVDEILNKNRPKFSYESEADYKLNLARLNKIDLQKECIRIGLMPHDNRDIMIKRLVDQFKVVEAQNNFAKMDKTPNKTKSPSSKVRDILAKGDNKIIY